MSYYNLPANAAATRHVPPNDMDETAPLLNHNDITTQPRQRSWLHPQSLSGLSILLCFLLGLIFWFVAASEVPVSYGFYLPYFMSEATLAGGQIAFFVALLSLLNYTRMRRSALELPWPINIPADFFIVLIAFGTGTWYLMTMAIMSDRANEQCTRYFPNHGREAKCFAYIALMRVMLSLAMCVLVLLAFTHAALAWIRIFKPPRDLQGLTTEQREGSSGGMVRANVNASVGGWFIGLGRGPFIVRNAGRERDIERRGDRSRRRSGSSSGSSSERRIPTGYPQYEQLQGDRGDIERGGGRKRSRSEDGDRSKQQQRGDGGDRGVEQGEDRTRSEDGDKSNQQQQQQRDDDGERSGKQGANKSKNTPRPRYDPDA